MSTSDRLNTDALSSLFLAVDEGNNENVIQILESDPNININEATILTTEQLTDHWKELAGNWTPFQWACRHNLLPIVDTLIAKGADVQLCREVSGNSCLFYAACCPDSIKLVLLLLEKAPNLVSHKSKDNWTPLMVASQNGYVPVVEALIQHGAPVLDKNNLGRSSLFLASEAGKPAVVEILLKTDALNTVNEQSSSGSFPLYAACKHGHLNVVKLLVEKGADVHQKNNNGWTTLQQTCLKGDLTMLQYLISKGASVNDKANDGTCPVYIAVQNGFVSILEMLILHGADITEESNGTDGKTPLMAACPMGHFNTAQLLLKKGATVNAADYKQNTALILASQAGHLPLVKELLAYGANVHAKCNDGRTALMFASQKGHFEVVVVLFAAGALLNDCDSAGLTALHHVCLSTDITEEKASEIIRFLIACGADSSIQSVQGDLALGLARTDKIRNELNHAIRDKNEGTLNVRNSSCICINIYKVFLFSLIYFYFILFF